MAQSEGGDLPTYRDLIYPTLLAVASLGGSARSIEINNHLVEQLDIAPEQLEIVYEGKTKSVVIDRMNWARSYAKAMGALDNPQRSLYLLSSLGKQLLALPADEARSRIDQLDRELRAARRSKSSVGASVASDDKAPEDGEGPPEDEEAAGMWREALLSRLHRLSPEGFEEFVIYLLRSFGLELRRVGGSGDEGVDGIGTAPISAVLSSRVAVQAKRRDPAAAIGRETVALFQRDAATAGAERAVLVTLARFTPPARAAATSTTPTVDLIDGDGICDLVFDKGIGLRTVHVVDEAWFDRFDAGAVKPPRSSDVNEFF